MEDQMSLSDGLSSQTHWRRFVTHLFQNLSTVSTFISKGGNRSNGGSNKFIWWLIKPWRRFVMHSIGFTFVSICGNKIRIEGDSTRRPISRQNPRGIHIYLCGPSLYQEGVTDRMEDQMSLFDGLSSQTHWRRCATHLLRNLSTVSTFISKGGNRSNAGSNEFIWWLIEPNSLKKVRDTSFAELFHWFYIHIKMWQQRIKGDFTRRPISRQNPRGIHVYLCGPQLICRRHATLHPTPLTAKDRGKC